MTESNVTAAREEFFRRGRPPSARLSSRIVVRVCPLLIADQAEPFMVMGCAARLPDEDLGPIFR
jgi:hypothetical protein